MLHFSIHPHTMQAEAEEFTVAQEAKKKVLVEKKAAPVRGTWRKSPELLNDVMKMIFNLTQFTIRRQLRRKPLGPWPYLPKPQHKRSAPKRRR